MRRNNIIQNLGLGLFPLSLALPIPLIYKSIALGIFLLFTIFLKVSNKSILKKNNVSNKTISATFVFFVFGEVFIGLLRDKTFYFHEVRLSFLLVPIIFYIAGEEVAKRKKKILKSFVLGTYLYIAFALSFLIYFYLSSDKVEFELNYYLKYVLYHYLPGALHHTYIGIFLCFTAGIILFELNLKTTTKLYLCLPLLIAQPFIGSKLSCTILLLTMLFWGTTQKEKNRMVLFLAAIALMAFNAYVYFFTDIFRTLTNSLNRRISYYQCGLEGVKDNFVLGIGNTNIKEFMAECSQVQENMDTHNLFYQELLSSGILGLVLLLGLFYVLFKLSNKNILLNYFLITFLIFGMVEHLFNTQLGVTYFVFFSFLLVDVYSIKQIDRTKSIRTR